MAHFAAGEDDRIGRMSVLGKDRMGDGMANRGSLGLFRHDVVFVFHYWSAPILDA